MTQTGTSGNDTLFGTAGADSLFGLTGSDQIIAGDGDDVVEIRDDGSTDTLDGGVGYDTLWFRGSNGTTLVLGGGILGFERVVIDADGAALAQTVVVEDAWFANLGDKGLDLSIIDYARNSTIVDGRSVLSGILSINGGSGNDSISGGGGGDYINGGPGDDFIRPGVNHRGLQVDTVVTGAGNDIIDYRGVSNGNHRIDYSGLSNDQSILLTLDTFSSAGGSASVVKGDLGIDTILGVGEVIDIPFATGAAYFQIIGTPSHDTFDIKLNSADWISILGMSGSDLYNISGQGWVRLDYSNAASGIEVDLIGGFILDGEGGADKIFPTGQYLVKEIQGSSQGDKFLGTPFYESFIPGGGDDTVDGGGGGDRIRYDLGSFADLRVNLGLGRATGNISGTAFVHHIYNIYVIRGSTGNDELIAGQAAARFEAGGGNDDLWGSLESDDLRGQSGDDNLRGAGGDDKLDGGDGNDTLNGGLGSDSLEGGTGTDTADYYLGSSSIGSIGPVTVSLLTGTATGSQGNDTLNSI